MRVLFITNYHQLYGANRSMLSIIEHFKRNGHDVCLFIPRKGDLSEELKRKGIDHLVIPYFSQLLYYKKALPYLALPLLFMVTLLSFPYMVYKAKKFKPDLIYSNTAAENIGIHIAKAIKVKHLTHVREFMDLDHDCHFFGGRKRMKKYICMSDMVLYVSKAVANHILLGEKVAGKHKVIYNGVKMDEYSLHPKSVTKDKQFGIVGLLDESKGQDLAIRYFSRIKDLYPGSLLHIWGDKEGGYKKMLLKLVHDLHLEKEVVFHGFEKDPEKIYGDMDVLLMCSRAEGFGRVTIEAMSRGIPVLGYNSGGTSELIINDHNGYLFKDQPSFENAVSSLFLNDNHYNQICKNAYTYAHENFSEHQYAQNVMTYVEESMNL